ncbi:MAG: TlpA disulfide reductase family protein [Chloroflexota bacterium]|nr:TlpA disulfide reductase family protein [Chloroflexota bacterium]
MIESKTDVLLLMLMGIVIMLMVAIIGLFLRMNQLQQAVLAALASSQAGMPEQEMGLEIGTQAPDFTRSDTNGTTVSLEAYAGQKVLLAFSSTHCSACKEVYPHLKAFSESRGGVQVVMMSEGSAEENRQLVQTRGFAFPVLPVLDWEDEVMLDYQVPGMPFFYVIDGERVIVNASFANTLEQLEALVEGSEE